MELYFVLDDNGEPRPEPDAEAWSRWFEQADRGVARTVVTPGVTVLTTFRGLVEALDRGGAPRPFETRVFGGVLDGEETHHRTRAEAVEGHAHLVEWCRLASSEEVGLTEDDAP